MSPSPADPWIIRTTLLVHSVAVCIWGLYARGYLPEPQNVLPQPIAIFVNLAGLLAFFACPAIILILAIFRPSRGATYAIIVELLLIYASAIALLPAVQ